MGEHQEERDSGAQWLKEGILPVVCRNWCPVHLNVRVIDLDSMPVANAATTLLDQVASGTAHSVVLVCDTPQNSTLFISEFVALLKQHHHGTRLLEHGATEIKWLSAVPDADSYSLRGVVWGSGQDNVRGISFDIVANWMLSAQKQEIWDSFLQS